MNEKYLEMNDLNWFKYVWYINCGWNVWHFLCMMMQFFLRKLVKADIINLNSIYLVKKQYNFFFKAGKTYLDKLHNFDLTIRRVHIKAGRSAAAEWTVLLRQGAQGWHGLGHIPLEVCLWSKQGFEFWFLFRIVRTAFSFPFTVCSHWRGHDRRGRIRQAVFLLATNFILELADAGARLVCHGEVKHAGCQVIPHELNVQKNFPSVLLLFPILIHQFVPAAKRIKQGLH